MALFGSLGKMLGLDTPFGRGLVTGFAETTADIVRDDMENERDRIDRIADYKIKKNEEELAEYRKEYEDNLEKIRAMQGLTGSLAGAEYMIRTYGMEEGLKKAQAIDVLKGYGIKPEFVSEENATTIEDLTNFITNAPQLSTVGKIEGTGLLSKIGLGRDIGADAQRQIDQATSELGYGVKQPVELGALPTMKGIDPEDFGMLADIKDEAGRLLRLSIAAREAGNIDEANRLASESTKLIQLDKTLNKTTALSEAGGRAFTKLITGHIADAAGYQTTTTYNPDGSATFKTNWETSQDQATANTAGARLAEIYQSAIEMGISTTTASRAIYEAASVNRLPEIITLDDGTVQIQTGTATLIDGGFSSGTGAYAPPPPPPIPPQNNVVTPSPTTTTTTTNQMPTQVGSGTQTSQIVPSASTIYTPKSISDLVKLHNDSTDMTERSSILAKIGRMYGGTIPKNILDTLN